MARFFQYVFPIIIRFQLLAIIEYDRFASLIAFVIVPFLYSPKQSLLLVIVTPRYLILSTTSMPSISPCLDDELNINILLFFLFSSKPRFLATLISTFIISIASLIDFAISSPSSAKKRTTIFIMVSSYPMFVFCNSCINTYVIRRKNTVEPLQ